MNKNVARILKILVGIILLILLIHFLGTNNILSTLLETAWYVIPLTIFSILFIAFLNAINFHLLAQALGSKIKFKKTLKITLISWSAARLVPGNLGDLSLIPLFKKEDLSYGQGSALVIVDKIINLLVLLILSSYAFIILVGLNNTIKIALLLLIPVALFLILIINKRTKKTLRKFLPKFLKEYSQGFSKSINQLVLKSPIEILINFILTFLKMASAAILFWIMFKSYNLSVPFETIISIKALGSVASYLPISPGGLGLKEGVIAFAYQQFSINPTIPSVVYLINRFFLFVLAFLFGFLALKEIKTN
jgi:glycosyltransferase 2 family protein